MGYSMTEFALPPKLLPLFAGYTAITTILAKQYFVTSWHRVDSISSLALNTITGTAERMDMT